MPLCGAYVSANVFTVFTIVFEAFALITGLLTLVIRNLNNISMAKLFLIGICGYFFFNGFFYFCHFCLPTCYCNYLDYNDIRYSGNYISPEYRQYFANEEYLNYFNREYSYCPKNYHGSYIAIFIFDMATIVFSILILISKPIPYRTVFFMACVLAQLISTWVAFFSRRYVKTTAHKELPNLSERIMSYVFDTTTQFGRVRNRKDCTGNSSECFYVYDDRTDIFTHYTGTFIPDPQLFNLVIRGPVGEDPPIVNNINISQLLYQMNFYGRYTPWQVFAYDYVHFLFVNVLAVMASFLFGSGKKDSLER